MSRSGDSVCLTPLLSATGPTEYYTCSIQAPWQVTAHATRIRKSIASMGYANLPAPDLGWIILRSERSLHAQHSILVHWASHCQVLIYRLHVQSVAEFHSFFHNSRPKNGCCLIRKHCYRSSMLPSKNKLLLIVIK